QQQASLLQVHSENLQLQRLVVERLLGLAPTVVAVSQPQAPATTTAPPPTAAPQPLPMPTSATNDVHDATRGYPEAVAPERSNVTPSTVAAASVPPPSGEMERATDARAATSYAARYYQSRPTASMKPSQPQDLELMRRLHEMGDSSGLILN